MNKSLKDIVHRYKIMRGFKVSYIPGWDCHGLPIELKALQNSKKEISLNNPIEIRNKAKELATKEIEEQSKDFQRWGIMANWNDYYKTMGFASFSTFIYLLRSSL